MSKVEISTLENVDQIRNFLTRGGCIFAVYAGKGKLFSFNFEKNVSLKITIGIRLVILSLHPSRQEKDKSTF